MELDESAKRVNALISLLGNIPQPKLSEKVNVQQPIVSAWVRAKKAPAADTAFKLGALAAGAGDMDLALWFWERAIGAGPDLLEVFAEAITRRRLASPKLGDVIWAPASSGQRLPIPAQFADKERLYRWVTLDRRLPDSQFGAGDSLVLETTGVGNLFLLHDRLVLAQFPDVDLFADNPRHADWKRGGRLIGTVGIVESAIGEKKLYLATLDFDNSESCVIGQMEVAGDQQPQDFQPFEGCQILGRFVGGFKKKPEEKQK